MDKQVDQIIAYQKMIIKLLAIKNRPVKRLEEFCLGTSMHTACFESYIHALQDLLHNGRIRGYKIGTTPTLALVP